MLTHPDSLKDRLQRLVKDLAGLPCVSGLGFTDARADQVKKNLATLSQAAEWKFVDLTDAKASTQAALEEVSRSPRVVIATAPGAQQEALLPLVKGLVDDRPEVELKPGVAKARPKGQQVVVLFHGAKSLSDVPTAFHSIPYWDFLP